MKLRRLFSRTNRLLFILLILALGFLFCLPTPLDNPNRSLVVLDRHGDIIGARLAADEQWRFPAADSLPQKYIQALLTFEDKRFFQHPGVDILALGRALRLNMKHRRIVSGGSTITMQVIRLAKKNPPRTIPQKLIEMIQALRLELSYSKGEILKIYANNCPLGGNVVGIEAASRIYFGRRSGELSWAEAALLAVLPNDPSLLFPGRNSILLKQKRDALLLRLRDRGFLDGESCTLALAEPIPEEKRVIRDYAPHWIQLLTQKGAKAEHFVHSSLDLALQSRVQDAADKHHQRLKQNYINNLAVLVVENERKTIVAYIGNSGSVYENLHSGYVDNILAPRSPGSALKPFLYAALFQEGKLLPTSLVADIPTNYSGYRPENYDRAYMGAAPAAEALARSLNVPAARLLAGYGVGNFLHLMQTLGFEHLNRSSDYYGLSVILGGGEVTLWELVQAYSSLASALISPKTRSEARAPLKVFYETLPMGKSDAAPNLPFGPGAVYALLEALKEVKRPDHHGNWIHFESAIPIAWKTGTSMGFRDAWAVGITPRYTVGVWAGNSSGEGRPDLTGLKAAAPLLFDVFNGLDKGKRWFDFPEIDMEAVEICQESGFRAGENCSRTRTELMPAAAIHSPLCHFHKIIFLDSTAQWQVNSQCYSPSKMVRRSIFQLPPAMAWFYHQRMPREILPAPHPDCDFLPKAKPVFIYPQRDVKIIIPRGLDGRIEAVVFEAVHPDPDAVLFWYLDDTFLGMSKSEHKMAAAPDAGQYWLSITDQYGNKAGRRVAIVMGEGE
jgi:penicillin-binding protein 1C